MVKDCLDQSPPFNSNLLWGVFHYPTYIDFHSSPTPYFPLQHMSLPACWQWIHCTFQCHSFCWENSEFVLSKVCLSHPLMCLDKSTTKISVQQTTNGWQPTKGTAIQHRVFNIIGYALWVKQQIFPIWKPKQGIICLGANWPVVHVN